MVGIELESGEIDAVPVVRRLFLAFLGGISARLNLSLSLTNHHQPDHEKLSVFLVNRECFS